MKTKTYYQIYILKGVLKKSMVIISHKFKLPITADPGKPLLDFEKTEDGVFLTQKCLYNRNFEKFEESVVKEKIFSELKNGVTCFTFPCFKDDN